MKIYIIIFVAVLVLMIHTGAQSVSGDDVGGQDGGGGDGGGWDGGGSDRPDERQEGTYTQEWPNRSRSKQ